MAVSVFCRQNVVTLIPAGRLTKRSYVVLDFRWPSTQSILIDRTCNGFMKQNNEIRETFSFTTRAKTTHKIPFEELDFSHPCMEQSLYVRFQLSIIPLVLQTLIAWKRCLLDIFGNGAKVCNTGATRSFLPELRGLTRLAVVAITLRYTT